MANSEVKKLEVSYYNNDKKNLTAKVVISVPSNYDVKNPDGSTSSSFNMPAQPGGIVDINLNFTEARPSGGSSRTNKLVRRTGYISLNNDFKKTQKTIARLYDPAGVEESKKSQTGSDYREDPEEEIGGKM